MSWSAVVRPILGHDGTFETPTRDTWKHGLLDVLVYIIHSSLCRYPLQLVELRKYTSGQCDRASNRLDGQILDGCFWVGKLKKASRPMNPRIQKQLSLLRCCEKSAIRLHGSRGQRDGERTEARMYLYRTARHSMYGNIAYIDP